MSEALAHRAEPKVRAGEKWTRFLALNDAQVKGLSTGPTFGSDALGRNSAASGPDLIHVQEPDDRTASSSKACRETRRRQRGLRVAVEGLCRERIQVRLGAYTRPI